MVWILNFEMTTPQKLRLAECFVEAVMVGLDRALPG